MKFHGFEFPDELYYLVEHDTWARLEGDGTATVGITAWGIKLSGDIYMCRPKSGRSIAVVELAKAIVSVKSPVTGLVVAVNALLEDQPELVHGDPYGDGWLARVKLADFAADSARLAQGDAAAAAMAHHARRMDDGGS
jgi:glycine cleavage system H protein